MTMANKETVQTPLRPRMPQPVAKSEQWRGPKEKKENSAKCHSKDDDREAVGDAKAWNIWS